MADRPLRIATRGSRLARWQTDFVAARLGVPTEIQIVRTEGDDRAGYLQGRTEPGAFTRALDRELLEGRADLAVHSLKDVPTALPAGLSLTAVPARAPIEDVLLIHPEQYDPSRQVPVKAGGRVGATSLRRQALLGVYAPDLEPTILRGNVPTRVRRLTEGDFAAIILARAGLSRLEIPIEGFVACLLPAAAWIPAPAQGALGIATADDSPAAPVVRRLDDAATHAAVDLERELMARFEAGCQAAFGAWAAAGDDGNTTVHIGGAHGDAPWAAASVTAPAGEVVDRALEALLLAAERGDPPPTSELRCPRLASF